MKYSLPSLKSSLAVALMSPLAGNAWSGIADFIPTQSSAVGEESGWNADTATLADGTGETQARFGGIFTNDLEVLGGSGFQTETRAAPFATLSVPVGESRGALAVDATTRMPESRCIPPVSEMWPSAPWISSDGFFEQAASAKYEYAGMFATITAIGIFNWNWGSSGFRFHNEGWFGDSTASGGMDKLGHAFTGYLMAELLADAIQRNSSDPRGGQFTAAALSISLMTYVELFDGFSGDHGFSYEDMTVDVLGAGFSVLRNTVPGLREKIDFRLQYLPSEYSGFEPFGDYSGQKYFLVVKLAGFEALRETPLRHVELHGGYFTRGFSKEEHQAGHDHERNLYVGIGLNLQEVLFGENPKPKHWAARMARRSLEYIQVPYTYLSSGGHSGP